MMMHGKQSRRRGRKTPRHGYSLSSILLLTTVAAIVCASVGTALVGTHRTEGAGGLILTGGIGGIMLGTLVGIGVGMNAVRRVRGVFLAVPAGMLSGVMVGAMVAVPNCLPAAATGAVILIAFAGVVRFFSSNSPQE